MSVNPPDPATAHNRQNSSTSPTTLASNNPFRNRPSGPPSPPPNISLRPISTNPFLDTTELVHSPSTAAPNTAEPNGNTSPSKEALTENTRELFEGLNVDKKPPRGTAPPAQSNGNKRRPENIPPRSYGRMPPPGHRPSQSEEERKKMIGRPRGASGAPLDIFADPSDPSKPREGRLRRNSETSVREKTNKLLDPDEQKKHDERRRHERRHRDKDGRRHKSKHPGHRLDVIDKLDVTSIFGTGVFHHDGPFDACNPHRNRRGHRGAPIEAFPKDSTNMMIGGSGPNNSKLNLDQIHGTQDEAHVDYNTSSFHDGYGYDMKRSNTGRATGFNPTDREAIHGPESTGLGTSTFLEGAPASRAAIQRRMTEEESIAAANAAGLSRKKSLAMKIRAVRPSGRMTSPEPITPAGANKSESNVNPSFKDYDKEYDKKGEQIASAEEKPNRTRAPSSPRRGLGLERRVTAESIDQDSETRMSGGGFLSRVKSLKGGLKGRPERRDGS